MVVIGEPIEAETPASSVATAKSWPTWVVALRDALAGTDLRSLAVFRIAIALIVLADLASRVGSLRVHYTDDGVLPRSIVEATQSNGRWSLLLLNGDPWFAGLIFGLCALSALALAFGFFTRLAALITWVLLMSIQYRNPGLLSAADNLLHQLLFWSVLLPLGARWSLDARRRGATGPNFYASLMSFGLFMQIAFMYWFTAVLKDGDDWRSDGTALAYTLNAGHLTTRFGEWAGQYQSVLEPLTWLSIGLEIFGPILLFIPFRNHWFRLIGIGAVMSFHLGIALTMDIGIFPWTSALCMLAFLPTWFWDTALPRLRKLPVRTSAPVSEKPGAKPVIALWLESLVTVLAAFSLIVVFFWNLMTIDRFDFPRDFRPVAFSMGLTQQWNMFSPQPPHRTEWYVVVGTQADGTQVNLIPAITSDDFNRSTPVSFDRPENIAAEWYGTKYWRKYFSYIASKDNGPERTALFSYTCRNWNAEHAEGQQMETVEIYLLTEPTRLGGPPALTNQARPYTYTCRG